MDPLVSILIPAYNSASWIEETLRCALNQTWKRKEVIVVDDGSKDDTLAVARRFASKEVLVHTQSNQGAAAARNQAMALSQGDYIQWLDADDLMSAEKIERQVKVLQESGARTLASCGWGRFLHRPGKARFASSGLWCDLTPLEWMTRKMEGNLHMQTATWLVSREVTEAAGPWDTRLTLDDDGEYFARVLLKADRVRFVPDASVLYRMSGPGCLSYMGRSSRKMESQFLSNQLNVQYIRSLSDDARVRAACVKYLETWLPGFYPERLDLVEQAKELAATWGGKLSLPELSWKYAWIKTVFGWDAAKKVQLGYNRAKRSVLNSWDKAMSRWERKSLPSG
jgi:glycosyltransferase involved in cell wall biosynthesis